jgi:hypothetical protein
MAGSDDIVAPETLQKAGSIEIFDENGAKVKFSTLYATQRTVVVFIRHFLCGNCMVPDLNHRWQQEYVSAVSSIIQPSDLLARDTCLVIIGCGNYSLIKSYVKETGAKYPIYANPSQSLFRSFELTRTLALGENKPDYMSFGVWGGIKKGILNAFKVGSSAFKAGDIKQIGGPQIFAWSRWRVHMGPQDDNDKGSCGSGRVGKSHWSWQLAWQSNGCDSKPYSKPISPYFATFFFVLRYWSSLGLVNVMGR